MARHEWASARNEDGFTADDMVMAGSWTDSKSLKGYTDVSLDHARKVVERTAKIRENAGQSTGQKRNVL